VAGNPRLGAAARQLVETALGDGKLLISAVSFCEVAWLHQAGRLALPGSPLAWRASVLAEGVREIPLDGEVAIAAAELAGFHKDPADRLIVATACDEGARLLTSGRQILGWAGALERIDARQ
jgi:PIN domain nuclease of toxin-antitoxin system